MLHRRHSYKLLLVALIVLSGCERPPSEPPPDPAVGRACFDLHLVGLPPGSQYEGFRVAGDRVLVRAMTGAGVEELECRLDSDGNLTLPGPGS
jgi:hypothetical protein